MKMSQQTTLVNYFKVKSSAHIMDVNKSKKRKSLSLIKKTPEKFIKVTDVVDLCSDDENTLVISEPLDMKQSQVTKTPLHNSTIKTEATTPHKIFNTDSELIEILPETFSPESVKVEPTEITSKHLITPSQNTIIKSEPTGVPSETFVSPSDSSVIKSELIEITPEIFISPSQSITLKSELTPNTSQSPQTFTPQKTPDSTRKNSPGSGKFYSPTKKRIVSKKATVKRNLAFVGPSQIVSLENEAFITACENLDDKSIFLLTIINKFLQEAQLRKLLDKPAESVLSKCMELVKPGIRLICRLFWRKQCWYRKDQLIKICSTDKNEKIDDPTFHLMINCLVEKGLVVQSSDKCISFEEYTNLLNGDEIKQICKELKIKINSKHAAVDALRIFSKRTSISSYFTGNTTSNASRLIGIMKSKAGVCYKLSQVSYDALHKLYVLMYLGINYEVIREKRLEFILINDKIKRETYPVDKNMETDSAAVVFDTSEEFLKYFNAHNIYEEYLCETETSTKCVTVNQVFELYNTISQAEMTRYKSFPIWLQRFTPPYIYIKILDNGIQELKKDKSGVHYQTALDILTKLIEQNTFRQHKKAEWYAEKALILHKLLGKHDEAAKLLLKGLKSNLSEESKAAMRPRAIKIANQQNIELDSVLRVSLLQEATKQLVLEKEFNAEHVNKCHMETNKQRGKKKFEVRTQDNRQYLDAEDYCIMHYTSEGNFTHGEHWEGRIITTIFFLLFWDIIYTKPRGVNGVFLSHYQLYPLDMHFESFYVNRKALIDERLASIEAMDTCEMLQIMKNKWDERPEYELSGINRSVGWDNIAMVCGCLGSGHVAALCSRLALNYGYAHSGFPDLTLWNVHTKQIKFVEVKTDTDKPSVKQLQWMRYLRERGIDTGFCYVGVNTTRSRARGGISQDS